MNKINWFWAHRRNSSLHHMDLLVRGFKNKGFLPVVNFHFNNQIVIGKEGKGCYLFYDRDQLNQKFKDIQKSIEENPNFAGDFKEINDKIFSDLFEVCDKIKALDLSILDEQQLKDLAIEFHDKITVGPLITVQLWGIEACWDEDYLLSKELSLKSKGEEFEKIKGNLSQSTGKSVAFSERESFLKVLVELNNNNPNIDSLIKEHVNNFEWINSEYVSSKLPFEEWKKLFQNESHKDAIAELRNLYSSYDSAAKKREELINTLGLSDKAKHILSALNEFVAQRDWAKGKFCYALSIYDLLLAEFSKRKNIPKQDLLSYSLHEILQNKTTENRKNFALVSKDGNLEIFSDNDYEDIILQEDLSHIFSTIKDAETGDIFKGTIASAGKVTGKVRIIEDPSKISEFKDDEILVTYMTTMEFTPIFKKAKGIITDEGGLSSHAAIISREFNLPCIVGTIVATRTLKTGDLVELDASEGVVRVIEKGGWRG